MWAGLLTFLLVLVGLFLVFIILLQRGRGGGLTGALGGLGGQSAFGTKAGDVFTRITIGIAIFWVILNCASIFANRAATEAYYPDRPGAIPELEAQDDEPEDRADVEPPAKKAPPPARKAE